MPSPSSPHHHHIATPYVSLLLILAFIITKKSTCYTSSRNTIRRASWIPHEKNNQESRMRCSNTNFKSLTLFQNLKAFSKNVDPTTTTLFLNNVGDNGDKNDFFMNGDEDEEIMENNSNQNDFMYDNDNGNDNDNDSDEEENIVYQKENRDILNQPTTTTASISNEDDNNDDNNWKYKMEEQQRQIDALMQLVKTQQQSNIATTTNTPTQPSIPNQSIPPQPMQMQTTTTAAVAPLKAMLFIDGTWLYYSVHQRREVDCPIMKKYGRGWQHFYKFDWSILPRIICEQLQEQQTIQGWSSSTSTSTSSNNQQQPNQQQIFQYHRPVEIVRASVYTSYKKTTDKNSLRVRMFQEMIENNYDVHLMETLGNSGEKCVDIQLAVEMLHYATVPNAYDIAIMLSGDKDFVPAMTRTRQKGKQVAIVSMRTGCNRALFESSHIKDYDMIWLDDFLDRLVVPIDELYDNDSMSNTNAASSHSSNPSASGAGAFLMIKIVHDFISKVSGGVSSRDIGRHLKKHKVGNSAMLDQMKEVYGGLRHFLAQHGRDFYTIYNRVDVVRGSNRDPRDKSFLVEVIDGSEHKLEEEASRTTFSLEEEKFLKIYYEQEEQMKQMDRDEYLNAYFHTFEDPLAGEFLGSPPDVVIVPNTNDKSQAIIDDDVGKTSDSVDYAKMIYTDDNQSNDQTDESGSTTAESTIDYSTYTVVMLKETCRERNLPVSGTKSALIERITNDVQTQISKNEAKKKLALLNKSADQESQYSSVSSSTSPPRQQHQFNTNPQQQQGSNRYRQSPPRSSSNQRSVASPTNTANNPSLTKHLDELLREYITASGGHASSRDVGRYLAANPGYISTRDSALKELKNNFTSLGQFVNQRKHVFVTVNVEDLPHNVVDHDPGEYKFYIGLR